MIFLIVVLLEGASMGALMIFHLVNFKKSRLLSDVQPDFWNDSVVKEELHFFSTEEICSHNLADESSSMNIQDLEESEDGEKQDCTNDIMYGGRTTANTVSQEHSGLVFSVSDLAKTTL